MLLVIDKLLVPTTHDLTIPRTLTSLAAMAVLLYGLIWDAE